MKKRVMLLICVMMAAIGLCACGGVKELSENFDEAAVNAAVEELIGYVNEGDAEGFCSVPMSEAMAENMTVESTKQIFDEYLGNKGDFVEYNSITIVGADDKTIGDCAVAVVSVKYENMNVQYTISYDKDMNLVGFFLK